MFKAYIRIFCLLFVAGFLLSSCESENAAGPETLTIDAITQGSDNNVYTGAPDDTVTTNVNISAPLGFLELVITKIEEDDTEIELERKVRANVAQMNVEEVHRYIIPRTDANSEFSIRYRVYDVSNASNDAIITVIVGNTQD